MNINELEGRELDAAVAEKVMGWKWALFGQPFTNHPEWGSTTRTLVDSNSEMMERPATGKEPKSRFYYCHAPNYSTDIAAAWLVVEKLRERGWYFVISTDDPYDVTFSVDVRDSRHGTWDTNGTYDKWITVDIRASTAPLAICRAALMAAEAE